MDRIMQQRMKELMDRSERFMSECGYDVRQVNGQRKSVLRNYDPQQTATSNGRTEVFIGKLPRDVFEIELFPIMRRAGLITELRIMMDFSGTTRGFAFAKYSTSQDCQLAIKNLNDTIIRADCPPIGVVESFDNRRLYFGGLPNGVTRESLMTQLRKLQLDVEDVHFPDSSVSQQARFAFVTFQSHEEATKARRILVPGEVKIFNRIITIDWAKPEKNCKSADEQQAPNELSENMNSLSLNSSGSSGINNISPPSIHSLPFKPRSPCIDFNNNKQNVTPFDITNYQKNINLGGMDILGDRTKQMLLSQNVLQQQQLQQARSNLFDYQQIFDPSFAPPPPPAPTSTKNTLTITNINFNTVTVNQLKAIFQLREAFPITSIYRSSFSSVTLSYTCPEHVDYMLHTLNTKPGSFQNIVTSNHTIGAYKGEIRLL